MHVKHSRDHCSVNGTESKVPLIPNLIDIASIRGSKSGLKKKNQSRDVRFRLPFRCSACVGVFASAEKESNEDVCRFPTDSVLGLVVPA